MDKAKMNKAQLGEVDRYIMFHYDHENDDEMASFLSGSLGCEVTADLVGRRRRGLGKLRDRSKPKVDPEEIEEQVAADVKAQRLQQTLDRTRALYKGAIRRVSDQTAIVEAITEFAPTLAALPPPKLIKPGDEVEMETPVFLFGDLHYGDVVDERETGGISVYNTRIARDRSLWTAEKVVKICRHHLRGGYHLPDLEVFSPGDMVSGIIHKELEVVAETGIIGQVVGAAGVLVEVLRIFAANFEHVAFTGVVGNHGRVEQKRYYKRKAMNNYDFLVYLLAREMLRDQENVEFNIPTSFWTIREVEGHRFLIMHGDNCKSWMGIPFYGLKREYLSWRSLAQSYVGGFEDLVVGHFHVPNIFRVTNEEVYMNGALIGGDEFSLGAVSAACDPIQLLFGMNRKQGRTWEYELNSKHIR